MDTGDWLRRYENRNHSDAEAARLVEFGRLRNRIFHRLIKHSYQQGQTIRWDGEEVVRGFEEGLDLETLLRDRLQKLTANYLQDMKGIVVFLSTNCSTMD